MPLTKQASKRKRRKEVVPALGVVGVSLSLASGASAATAGSVTDMPSKDTATGPGFALTEEEISDVSLGTFYVFDKEDLRAPLGEQVARGGVLVELDTRPGPADVGQGRLDPGVVAERVGLGIVQLHRNVAGPGISAEERQRQCARQQNRATHPAMQRDVLRHPGSVGEAGDDEPVVQVGRGVEGPLHQGREAAFLDIGVRGGVVVEDAAVVLVDDANRVPEAAQARGRVLHTGADSEG